MLTKHSPITSWARSNQASASTFAAAPRGPMPRNSNTSAGCVVCGLRPLRNHSPYSKILGKSLDRGDIKIRWTHLC